MATAAQGRLALGDLQIDLRSGEVWRGDGCVRLAPKPCEVLLALIERPGEVVTRDELRHRLWSDHTVVDFDNNLNSAMATLREALGDAAASPRFIETLPKRGYRLLAPVNVEPVAAEPATASTARPDRGRAGRARWAWAAVAVAGLALAAAARRGSTGSEGAPTAADPRVHEARERARYLLTRGDAGAAVGEIEKAVALDPRSAVLWSDLSRALLSMKVPARQVVERARAAAQRATALDPGLAEAALPLAQIALYHDYDWETAGRELERARRLSPDSSDVEQARAGYLAAQGRHDEAAAAMAHARRLDPVAVTIAADAGWYRFVARDPAGALAATAAALELDPTHRGARSYRVLTYRALGDLQHAAQEAAAYMALFADERGVPPPTLSGAPAQRLHAFDRWNLARHEALARSQHVPPGSLALAHLALGEHGAALGLLERAVEERAGWQPVFLSVYPPFDPLRDDPRFVALLRKVGPGGPS
jgi:DNA-binding winged helix-turn-helix (wHTH) protein/Tfp pilus assembly protein PilF